MYGTGNKEILQKLDPSCAYKELVLFYLLLGFWTVKWTSDFYE